MNRARHLAAVLVLAAVAFPAGAETDGSGKKTLVFVGYPDPSEFLMAKVLRRVGDAYEKRHPEVRVDVETGVGYLAAREMVLEGKATAMMISELLNEPRAYQTQHSVSGAHATYKLKLNHFLPVAARIIRSRKEKLAEMRLGVATHRISDALRRFLDFFGTKAAEKAVSDIRHLELTQPATRPKKIKEVVYKRRKVTLKSPILAY